jgi:hypothetical protein
MFDISGGGYPNDYQTMINSNHQNPYSFVYPPQFYPSNNQMNFLPPQQNLQGFNYYPQGITNINSSNQNS